MISVAPAGPTAVDPLGPRPAATGLSWADETAMFQAGLLNAYTQTLARCIIFFFASCGASAAYLTVSEIFPMEIRAQAIALFFAIAQCFGAFGPWFYGQLIGDGTNHAMLTFGYLIGAAVMVIGGLVEVFLGVDAENKSLEDVATPLSVVAEPEPVAA
jgi:MFS family permease